MSEKKIDENVKRREYSLGFCGGLSDTDVRACFREAVNRIRQIYVDRMLGRISPEDEVTKKLLDGEFEYLVPPGHTINITAQPQVTFKPERLILDDEAAEWYDVADIKVGRCSQLVSSSMLPGTAFKAGVSPIQSMDTVQISMLVTLSLINVSTKPRRPPRAMMTGRGVDQ